MDRRRTGDKETLHTQADVAGSSSEAFCQYADESKAHSRDCWYLSPRKFRRSLRHGLIARVVKYTLVLTLALVVFTPIIAPSYSSPPPQYRELAARCTRHATPGCANVFQEKVFIAISLYDKDGHLAGGTWAKSLLELIRIIGSDNVFLSIYENDSGPEGAQALENLKGQLTCRHRIVNDAHVPITGFPTITMPDGTERVKRLAYLSEMRNRALKPLDLFNETELGVGQFDKVLFLNDVFFRPTDAASLLFSTNLGVDGRTNYLAVCSMDFMNPLLFYDLYAQRDAEGFSCGLPIFPFFSTAGKGISRRAVLAQSDAVPVKSCWGGMVATQAKHLQNLNDALPSPGFQEPGSHVIDPWSPTKVKGPVRFRYEPEVFFDACECCLLHADLRQAAKNQGAEAPGTFVNPYVRVAYSQPMLQWLPWVRRWERLFVLPQWILTKIIGLPTHNPHRLIEEGDHFMEEIWAGPQPGHWEMTKRTGRSGMFCAVREMQLVQTRERTEDINWENTKMPPGQALYFPT
jgi:hypothetical protein